MRRIVVTGGAGFIGSHLIDRLLAEPDNHIICVDNLFTGQETNITQHKGSDRFEFINHDIVQPLYLENIDQIYNLACPASPIHYQHNPIKTIKTSTIGMINMLGLAHSTGARLLQASTSEVYGDPQIHPQPESYFGNVNTLGPRACYDEGKRVAETLCMDYHREHGMAVRLVRIFNTYGPRMQPHDGRVVSNFIVAALKNEPLVLHGQGQQTRSFCYVDDLVEGIMRMMNQEESTGPVNLGNPFEITVQELAENIIALTNSQSPIEYLAARPDDPQQRQPDINLAKQLLAWQPTTDLQTGLEKTISYFKNLP